MIFTIKYMGCPLTSKDAGLGIGLQNLPRLMEILVPLATANIMLPHLVPEQKQNKNMTMEQHTLKNVINCWNTSIYSQSSGGQSSSLYLNVVHFSTPVLIRHLCQLKTVVFLHWCHIWAVLFHNHLHSLNNNTHGSNVLKDLFNICV